MPSRSARRLGLLVVVSAVSILSACRHSAPDELAQELIAEKNYQAAETVLREAVEADPSDLGLQFQYGSLLASLQKCNQALWPLMRAETGEEFADVAAPLVARCLAQTSNHSDAIRVMSGHLDKHPDDMSIRRMRAFSLVANHEEQKALADIDWILEHGPKAEDFGILELKLRALLQLQKADEAQAFLSDLRAREDTLLVPDRAPRLCAVDANFSAERGDLEGARTKFESCFEQYPDSEVVASRAVAFLDARGEAVRATEILENALDERPDSLTLRKALADRYRGLGRADEARDLLRGAREQNRIAAAGMLAEHHMDLDDPVSALADFEWAIQAESDDELFGELSEQYRFMLGDILVLCRANERARRLISFIEEPAYREFLEARILYEGGDYERALAAFDEGFRIWPSSPGPRSLAGRAAEQIGDFNAAVDHYRAALRSDAEASDAGLALARIYAAQGSFAAAVEALQYHTKAHPRDARALRMLAELQVRLGNRNLAAQIRGALSEIPGQLDLALADHARNLAILESPSLALEFIDQRAPNLLDPTYRETLAAWCEIMTGSGRGEEALRTLELASSAPDVRASDLQVLKAQILISLGRESEAEPILDSAVGAEADDAWGLLALARLRAKQARIEEALALYDRAAELEDDEPLASFEAAQMLAGGANVERTRRIEAARRAREALRREPTHGAAALLLARLGIEGGDHGDEVLAQAERAARFAPGPESAEMLGLVLLTRGDGERAVNALRQAVEAGAEGGRIHYELGRALSLTGDLLNAREELAKSLASGPFDEADAARLELSRLEHRLGREAI